VGLRPKLVLKPSS